MTDTTKRTLVPAAGLHEGDEVRLPTGSRARVLRINEALREVTVQRVDGEIAHFRIANVRRSKP